MKIVSPMPNIRLRLALGVKTAVCPRVGHEVKEPVC